MKGGMKGAKLHQDVRIIWDRKLDCPVLQIGVWKTISGVVVGHEVCTMVHRREPLDIGPVPDLIPPPPAARGAD